MRVVEAIHPRLPNTHLVMHGSSSVPQELQDEFNKVGGAMRQTFGASWRRRTSEPSGRESSSIWSIPATCRADLAPRRVRGTTRKAANVAAGDSRRSCRRDAAPLARRACRAAMTLRETPISKASARWVRLWGRSKWNSRRREISWGQHFSASIDQSARSPRLARRCDHRRRQGAVAAAMVTGKRDFLSNDAKDLIREAGIFHVITISGVQMTLVAGIFFFVARRLLALSPTLALNYPIKKWAAVVAMIGSAFYDVATGSRVGAERALIMTLIVLGAVILDRRALTMRNLAFAAFAIVALEPEAVLGVSFQLSFAAVGALVAVMEARLARAEATRPLSSRARPRVEAGALADSFRG